MAPTPPLPPVDELALRRLAPRRLVPRRLVPLRLFSRWLTPRRLAPQRRCAGLPLLERAVSHSSREERPTRHPRPRPPPPLPLLPSLPLPPSPLPPPLPRPPPPPPLSLPPPPLPPPPSPPSSGRLPGRGCPHPRRQLGPPALSYPSLHRKQAPPRPACRPCHPCCHGRNRRRFLRHAQRRRRRQRDVDEPVHLPPAVPVGLFRCRARRRVGLRPSPTGSRGYPLCCSQPLWMAWQRRAGHLSKRPLRRAPFPLPSPNGQQATPTLAPMPLLSWTAATARWHRHPRPLPPPPPSLLPPLPFRVRRRGLPPPYTTTMRWWTC